MGEFKSKDPNEVGAAWIKTSAKGDWLSVKVEKDIPAGHYVMFRTDKRSEKAPDYRLLKSQPKSKTDDPIPF